MKTILFKEVRDALRGRWLLGYAALLASVGLIAAHTASTTSAGLALQTFGRTTATLTNFCLFLAPLIAVTMGAAAIAGERDRGTLDFLLAQPLARWEIVLGKYLGLLVAITAATILGFAPAGAIVGIVAGPAAFAHFLWFPALSVLLVATMLGVGLLVSVRSRTAVQAQGRAIFLWFAFVLLYDLILMGTIVGAGLPAGPLAALLVANPVDSARVLGVLLLEPDLYLLGPAGAFLVEALDVRGTAALLLTSQLAWAAGALGASVRSFRLRATRGTRSSVPVFRGVKSHA